LCTDFQGLQSDPWLQKEGILPPGHPQAPAQCGSVFWVLIDQVLQEVRLLLHATPRFRETDSQPSKTPILTLSLANNGFKTLNQLSRLPLSLPYLRALDLSDNPIHSVKELDELLAASEKKGKANTGLGGLKNLIELKLNGCAFREQTLQKPSGDELYQQ
jgi:nuclear RNA export factor